MIYCLQSLQHLREGLSTEELSRSHVGDMKERLHDLSHRVSVDETELIIRNGNYLRAEHSYTSCTSCSLIIFALIDTVTFEQTWHATSQSCCWAAVLLLVGSGETH